MKDIRLEDAEAIRLLREDACSLARDARRFSDVADRLAHAATRLAADSLLEERPNPRAVLGALGATSELFANIAVAHGGVVQAADALHIAVIPRSDPHPVLQDKARAELAALLKRDSES